MHAQCGHLREQVLRVANTCFGHRLMMDRIVPGGVKQDLASEAGKHVRSLLDEIRKRFPGARFAFNYSSSFKWHNEKNPITWDDLADLGVGFIFITLALQHAAGHGMSVLLDGLKNDKEQGYMALHNEYQIHRRVLEDRNLRDVAWFAYAHALDTLFFTRHLLVPRRWGPTVRQLGGRLTAACSLLVRR